MTSNADRKDLLLKDFKPVSRLVVRKTEIDKPRFPVIDAHNHLTLEGFGAWGERPLSQLIDVLDAAQVQDLVDLDGGGGERIIH